MAAKQVGLLYLEIFLGGGLLNFCSLTPFPGSRNDCHSDPPTSTPPSATPKEKAATLSSA
jgi:hypothetical protein